VDERLRVLAPPKQEAEGGAVRGEGDAVKGPGRVSAGLRWRRCLPLLRWVVLMWLFSCSAVVPQLLPGFNLALVTHAAGPPRRSSAHSRT